MSDSVEGVGPQPPYGEQPPQGARPPTEGHDTEGGGGRRWLIVGLVVLGLVAAGLIGYVIGDSGSDDDVKSASAEASQAQKDADAAKKQAAAAEQALKDDQAKDEQAVQGINKGIEDLGNAIQQEDAKDDQAAQDAVDQAANDIQSGLEQLGADASKNVDKALTDLSGKVNEAVGSQSTDGAQGATEAEQAVPRPPSPVRGDARNRPEVLTRRADALQGEDPDHAADGARRRPSGELAAARRGGMSKSHSGWVTFAGVMLFIAGVLNVIYGVAAIGDSGFFAHDQKYILSNLNTWGWVNLVLGALQLFAAFSLWSGGSTEGSWPSWRRA